MIQTHTFTLPSASHSLPTNIYGKSRLPSVEGRRRNINSNLKYCGLDTTTRASSAPWLSDDHSEKNNVSYKLITTSKKSYDVLVRSYSSRQDQLQQSDSNIIPRFIEPLITIYRFCRPYTLARTAVAVVSVATLPLTSFAQINSAFIVGVLQALGLSLLPRVYIQGINGIYDVEIDKINKPYLPLASGALSMELAVAIVSMSFVGSVAWGIMSGSPPLFFSVLVALLFGTLYSVKLPYMRWKRHTILVSIAVTVVNAIAVPFSIFIHIQKYVLGRPTMSFTRSLIFASVFTAVASIIIGIFKDIPDILGDKENGLQTLAIRIGAERVFWICISAYIMTYGCAIGIGLTSSSLITKLVTVPGHLSLACILLYQALSVDLSDNTATHRLYMLLWNFTCAEFLLIPFVR